jgi:hypothetical protein
VETRKDGAMFHNLEEQLEMELQHNYSQMANLLFIIILRQQRTLAPPIKVSV